MSLRDPAGFAAQWLMDARARVARSKHERGMEKLRTMHATERPTIEGCSYAEHDLPSAADVTRWRDRQEREPIAVAIDDAWEIA